jgi:hypothetical protein
MLLLKARLYYSMPQDGHDALPPDTADGAIMAVCFCPYG